MDCTLRLTATVRFVPGSGEVSASEVADQLREAMPVFENLLRADVRKLTVVGHAEASERSSLAARVQLATLRAERVRQWLVEQGLADAKLTTRVFGATQKDHRDGARTGHIVTFEIAPDRPVRSDRDDPEWLRREWCKSPKGFAPNP